MYCPFVTTFSGLYRYNMNDILMASEPLFGTTPRVHMVSKVNGIVTITGEKLYEGQFVDAVKKAEQDLQMPLNYFCGYANLPKSCYDWLFEFTDQATSQEAAEKFAQEVDKNLKKANIEYEAKRNSFRLKDAQVFRLQEHSFQMWKTGIINRTGQDASRFKPNVLAQNEERHQEILKYVLKD